LADEQRRDILKRMQGTERIPLIPQTDGTFTYDDTTKQLHAGDKFEMLLKDKETGQVTERPTLEARWLPEGLGGPEQLPELDPDKMYQWADQGFTPAWKLNSDPSDFNVDVSKAALYQMHIGTFTKEGTYLAAADKLDTLKNLGINTLQLMPITEFPGQFGWGYDTTRLFAPESAYGKPDDLKHLIDKAHQKGIAVILDMVFNHLGPELDDYELFDPNYLSNTGTDFGKGLRLC